MLKLGPNAQILAMRVGFGPLRIGFEPQSWDLVLEGGILALRLRFGPEAGT